MGSRRRDAATATGRVARVSPVRLVARLMHRTVRSTVVCITPVGCITLRPGTSEGLCTGPSGRRLSASPRLVASPCGRSRRKGDALARQDDGCLHLPGWMHEPRGPCAARRRTLGRVSSPRAHATARAGSATRRWPPLARRDPNARTATPRPARRFIALFLSVTTDDRCAHGPRTVLTGRRRPRPLRRGRRRASLRRSDRRGRHRTHRRPTSWRPTAV